MDGPVAPEAMAGMAAVQWHRRMSQRIGSVHVKGPTSTRQMVGSAAMQ